MLLLLVFQSLASHLTSPMDVRGSQSLTTGSSPTNDSPKSFLTPKIPARHHTSDLTLLSQSPVPGASIRDGEPLAQRQSQTSGSVDHIDSKSERARPSQQPSTNSIPSQFSDPRPDKVPHTQISSNSSKNMQLLSSSSVESTATSSVEHRPTQVDGHRTTNITDVSDVEQCVISQPAISIPSYDAKDKSSVLRPRGAHSLSDQEARTQTRQRILQSAKLRQNEEVKLLQRKSAGNS